MGDVRAALNKFTPTAGLTTEAKYRDALTLHLSSALRVSPKREAGIHGQGTRVDIFFEHRDEDFIVTIKQGINEQKTKILLGEAVIVAASLLLNEHPRRTNVVVLVILDGKKPAALDGHLRALGTGMGLLSRHASAADEGNVGFHLALGDSDGIAIRGD